MILQVLIGLGIVGLLIWLIWSRGNKPTTRVNSDERKYYDNQYEVFRDMEPVTQTRENPWMGFLQVDLSKDASGAIGNFKGNDSSSGTAFMYEIDMLPETAPVEKAGGSNKQSVLIINDREYGPGSYDYPVDAREIKVYGPVDITALDKNGNVEKLHYDAQASGYYNLVLDDDRNWTKITISS